MSPQLLTWLTTVTYLMAQLLLYIAYLIKSIPTMLCVLWPYDYIFNSEHDSLQDLMEQLYTIQVREKSFPEMKKKM